jgi:hypothetical protein
VLWHLVFDTEAAARRALVAFARGAVRPELGDAPASPDKPRAFADLNQAKAAIQRDQFCKLRPHRGPFAAVRHGTHIGVTLGPYTRGATVSASGDCALALTLATRSTQQR